MESEKGRLKKAPQQTRGILLIYISFTIAEISYMINVGWFKGGTVFVNSNSLCR